MAGAEGWTQPTDATGIFRDMEKRIQHGNRNGAQPMPENINGPGLVPRAVRVEDWNDPACTFNGFFYSLPGAENAPIIDNRWIGVVAALDDNTGVQQVWQGLEEGEEGPPLMYIRYFYSVGDGQYNYSDWGYARVIGAVIEGGRIVGGVIEVGNGTDLGITMDSNNLGGRILFSFQGGYKEGLIQGFDSPTFSAISITSPQKFNGSTSSYVSLRGSGGPAYPTVKSRVTVGAEEVIVTSGTVDLTNAVLTAFTAGNGGVGTGSFRDSVDARVSRSYDAGEYTGNTNASAQITIAHNLGATPRSIAFVGSETYGSARHFYTYDNVGPATFRVTVRNTTGGLVSSPTRFMWTVYR